MPIYDFKCEECGNEQHEITLSIRENVPEPECCGTRMIRDYRTGRGHNAGYDKPILSDALGVHPSQLKAEQVRHPDREYTPDGRLVIRSHQDRERYLKQDGYHDLN